MAEIIELTEEDARDIAFGDHPDYVEVTEYINDTSQWAEFLTTIVQREDGKLFKMNWSRGLTDEDKDDDEDDEFYCYPKLVEVEQKTRTIVQTYYEEVK